MSALSRRAQDAQKRRAEFLERFSKLLVPMTEEEFYTWENGDEEYVVPLIKKYLRTPAEKTVLAQMDLTIEDCLNGRIVGEDQRTYVYAMFEAWNAKLGWKQFGS